MLPQKKVPHPLRGLLARRVGRYRCAIALLLFCFLFPASFSLGQNTARTLAARVDHHYNALHSLRVQFVQQYDGMGQHRGESGRLLLKKPGRMRWTYDQPAGKLFVLDGHNAYFYTPGQSEVQRVAAKKLDDLRSPLRFLLGHSELGKEMTGLTMTSDGEDFDLTGVPKNMEQRVSSLRFTVTADGTIKAIRIEEPDGAVSQFTFNGEEGNVPASDADFVFHAPAGTLVVEGLPPA